MADFKELNEKLNNLNQAVDRVAKAFEESASDSVDQAAVDDLEVKLQEIRDRLDSVTAPPPQEPAEPQVPANPEGTGQAADGVPTPGPDNTTVQK